MILKHLCGSAGACPSRFVTRLGLIGLLAVAASRAGMSLRDFAVSLGQGVPDFAIFFHTARCLVSGCDPYFDAPALNLNPPLFHVLVLPLISLDLSIAALVWTLAGLTIAAWAFWCIAFTLQLSGRMTAVLVGVWLASICAEQALRQGQLSLILFGPITLLWRAAREERWSAAGSWAGLLIAVKPFLGLIVIWFAVRRQWRAAGLACGVAAALLNLGIVVFGWHATYGWLTALASVRETAVPENGSLVSWISRTISATSQYQPVLLAPDAVLPVWLTVTSAVLTLVLVHARAEVDRSLLLVFLAALLISPMGWAHYGLWLVGPLAATLQRAPSRWAVAGVVALCLPRIDPGAPPMAGWWAVSIGSAVPFAYVALFIGVLSPSGTEGLRPDAKPRL